MQSIKRTPASRQKRYVARNARFNDMSISSARYFETPAVQFHATAVELQGRRSMLLQPLLKQLQSKRKKHIEKKWKGNDEKRTETSWTHTHVRATCSKHMAALHQTGEGTL
jgi:hypothetical protein